MQAKANKAAINLILNPGLTAKPLTPNPQSSETQVAREQLVERLHVLNAETGSHLPSLVHQVQNKGPVIVQPTVQAKVVRPPNDINVMNKLKFVEYANRKVYDSYHKTVLKRNDAQSIIIATPADNKDGTPSISHVYTIAKTDLPDLLVFLEAHKPQVRETPTREPQVANQQQPQVEMLDVAKEQSSIPVSDWTPNSFINSLNQPQ